MPTPCRAGSARRRARRTRWPSSPARAARTAARAKALLSDPGYDYVEVPLPHQTRSRVVGADTGRRTVTQVFINGEHIGGADELEQWAGRQRKAA